MNLRKILLLLFLSAGISLHAQVRFDRTTYDLGNCPEDTVRPASRPRRSIFPAPPLPHRNSPVLLR